MYTKAKSISEVDLEKYGDFRLCYVDSIEETIYNESYDPSNFRIEGGPWIDNPEYIEGVSDKIAFFTPYYDEAWGDDWDDAPYEHNAGYPYDDIWIGDQRVDIEILQVNFSAPRSYYVKYPEDYGCGNSPFCVEDINLGAVPWIFGVRGNRGNRESLVIRGGITLKEFVEKIRED